MAKGNIRKKFHKLIDEFEDDKYLSYVFEAMETYNKKSKEADSIMDEVDELDELTKQQKKDMKEAIRQDEEGDTFTHAQVKKMIRKWLTE